MDVRPAYRADDKLSGFAASATLHADPGRLYLFEDDARFLQ